MVVHGGRMQLSAPHAQGHVDHSTLTTRSMHGRDILRFVQSLIAFIHCLFIIYTIKFYLDILNSIHPGPRSFFNFFFQAIPSSGTEPSQIE